MTRIEKSSPAGRGQDEWASSAASPVDAGFDANNATTQLLLCVASAAYKKRFFSHSLARSPNLTLAVTKAADIQI